MRIISNFHDYYDSVQVHGQDPKLIYQRKQISIPKEEQLFTFDYFSYNAYLNRVAPEITLVNEKQRGIDSFVIGFCGKMYPVIQHYWNQELHHIYSKEDAQYIEEIKIGNDYLESILPERTSKFFEQKITTNFDQTFIKFKVPSFIIFREQDQGLPYNGKLWDKMKNSYKLVLNPNLGKCNFQSVKDPYTSFQEIEQFLSGVLSVDSPEMVTIGDKEKVKKAGFDKWSFRKLPTKRKLNENK